MSYPVKRENDYQWVKDSNVSSVNSILMQDGATEYLLHVHFDVYGNPVGSVTTLLDGTTPYEPSNTDLVNGGSKTQSITITSPKWVSVIANDDVTVTIGGVSVGSVQALSTFAWLERPNYTYPNFQLTSTSDFQVFWLG